MRSTRSSWGGEKGLVDFVIQGILEFLGEIGRKRIVIRSDNEPAVKALVQAVALHREDETVLEEIPVKSSQSILCNEHDHYLVGGMARALRIDMEKRFGDNFPVLHAVYSWILRHSGWLLCRQRWLHSLPERYKGRIYSGEVCDLFECVLFKVPSPEEAKLDDRFRLGVWIGKTSRIDDHLIFDGDEVRKCRTVKRRPEYLRWDRVRVDAIAASSSAGPVSMEQAQFDVEITEATPKRIELEEMPESRKVRKINGLAVCSIDIVGAAQADNDDPRSSDDELKRKAAEESDAVHTHEGEPMKSFEVPIPERDIVGVKSGVVLDPVKVQVARQKEIDSIARHEVVELVRISECKQGTHVKGGWSRTTRVTSLLSIAVSNALIFCGSAVVLSVWDIQWRSFTQ